MKQVWTEKQKHAGVCVFVWLKMSLSYPFDWIDISSKSYFHCKSWILYYFTASYKKEKLCSSSFLSLLSSEVFPSWNLEVFLSFLFVCCCCCWGQILVSHCDLGMQKLHKIQFYLIKLCCNNFQCEWKYKKLTQKEKKLIPSFTNNVFFFMKEH